MVSQADRRAATVAAILAAARKLFDAHGFEATTMDDVVAKAGTAKGAIYHHFPSKEALFGRVLETIQEELAAAQVPGASRGLRDPMDRIAGGVLRYLLAATEPGRKRILLVDGPAVLGWRKWREIDDRYFGAGARMAVTAALGEGAAATEIEAVTHLLLGAVMEAALVCAAAKNPRKAARDQTAALRKMLEGLRK
ncbi:MAG TPA: helix-turn-helix domain-containing protein [Rhizomicrobium sp.]|nr:helix-turn-helix domain-containing protein [Rhizomicrobium sp.]